MPSVVKTTSRRVKPLHVADEAVPPAVGLFRAFADPTRLRLLALLRAAKQAGRAEVCVCDLVAALAVPQPTASRHLAYLRRERLVACRKEGAWCHYRLLPAAGPLHRRLLATLDVLEGVLPEAAEDTKRLLAAGDSCAAAGCC